MRDARLLVALGTLLAASSGCYGVEDSAKIRAAGEFHCPEDRVVLTARPDLSEDTVDVEACGHRARYTCPEKRNQGEPRACVREPLQ